MNDPWMLMTGCAIVGFLLPDFLLTGKARIPVGVNLLGALAGALISGSFVL